MATTEGELLARSVAALGVGDMSAQDAEHALRREACAIACELIKELVADGNCSVTVRFEGIDREAWAELPFRRGSHWQETKVQEIAGRRVLVEYVVADGEGES